MVVILFFFVCFPEMFIFFSVGGSLPLFLVCRFPGNDSTSWLSWIILYVRLLLECFGHSRIAWIDFSFAEQSSLNWYSTAPDIINGQLMTMPVPNQSHLHLRVQAVFIFNWWNEKPRVLQVDVGHVKNDSSSFWERDGLVDDLLFGLEKNWMKLGHESTGKKKLHTYTV
jgi:hypothetical protein